MKPSQVRAHVLGDHEHLRARLRSLERHGKRVLEGSEGELAALRDEVEDFLARLREHMGWEELHLRTALLEADAWGQERARHLDDDHREQRELLELILRVVGDRSRPPPLVARNVLDLVALVLDDMVEEERWLLDERVLRDDVISIEAEDG